jgi:Flp pilus assembly protein TadG
MDNVRISRLRNDLGRGERSHGRRRRSGMQVLEMALALPVLLFLSMGMVEYGQFFYIKHCFEAAARDGSRYAILSTATQSQMVTTLRASLLQANVTYNASWLSMSDLTAGSTVTDISQVPAGDQMQITLSATYSTIPNVVRPLFSMTGEGIGSSKILYTTSVVVKE